MCAISHLNQQGNVSFYTKDPSQKRNTQKNCGNYKKMDDQQHSTYPVLQKRETPKKATVRLKLSKGEK